MHLLARQEVTSLDLSPAPQDWLQELQLLQLCLECLASRWQNRSNRTCDIKQLNIGVGVSGRLFTRNNYDFQLENKRNSIKLNVELDREIIESND